MRLAIALLAVLAPAGALPPQDAPARSLEALEAERNEKAVAVLLDFARRAERGGLRSRAKEAYELLLTYDPENRPARKALGFLKMAGEWRPMRNRPTFRDRAPRAVRDALEEAWKRTALALAAAHRDFGLALLDRDRERGLAELRKALEFDPRDARAHEGLGHVGKDGFHLTADEALFVERLRSLESFAKALRTRTFEVQALPAASLPRELAATGLEFQGARTAHFTIFARGTQQEAAECALWAERAREFLLRLLGEKRFAELEVDRRLSFGHAAFVWGAGERDQFLSANPKTWEGQDESNLRRFDDFFWEAGGRTNALVWTMPERIHDRIVGFVAYQGFLFGRNPGLGEGLLHACTWYLLGTTWTWYGSLPSTQASGDSLLQPDPDAWLARLREQIRKGEDWPIAQIPREPLTHYRPKVRVKSWSFMSWLLARHPERWLDFFLALSERKVLMPEQVEALGEDAFGAPLAEVEIEWRRWAAGEADVARASGHGR
ncbi:MAG: hypothetical protein Fur0037_02110 [Planctomycetota bacterium]